MSFKNNRIILKTLFLMVITFLITASVFPQNKTTPKIKSLNIKVTSSSFKENNFIPIKYTCEGEDISPPLQWNKVPKSTKSIALICDDPDAPMGTWVHWVIFNLPPNLSGLPEGVSKKFLDSIGAVEGINNFKRTSYGGPCPPKGKPHRYFFKVYALDIKINTNKALTKDELISEMNNHILAEGKIIGLYQRK